MPWFVFYMSVLFPMLVFLLITMDELWPSDSAHAPAIRNHAVHAGRHAIDNVDTEW